MQQSSVGPNSGPILFEGKNGIKEGFASFDNDVLIKQENSEKIKVKQEIFDSQDCKEIDQVYRNVNNDKKLNNESLNIEENKKHRREVVDLPVIERQYSTMQHPAYRHTVGTAMLTNSNKLNNNINNNTFNFPHFYPPMLPQFPLNTYQEYEIKSNREKFINNIINKNNNEFSDDRLKTFKNIGYNNNDNNRQLNTNKTGDFNDTLLRDYRSHHDFHQTKLPGYPAVSSSSSSSSLTPTFYSSIEMSYFNQHQQQQKNLHQQQANQLNNISSFYQGRHQKKWSNSALRTRQPSVSFQKKIIFPSCEFCNNVFTFLIFEPIFFFNPFFLFAIICCR